jgi:purine-binding chemotaxis protein CheW
MADNPSLSEPFILFQLAGATYGLRSRDVGQVEMIEHITPVPDAHPSIEGVVFSRGQVIPAVNLRVRFGFEKVPFTLRTRLIVARTEGRTVGFIVDSAREFTSIPAETIVPPPEQISGLSGKYLEGIAARGNRLILILSVEEVLKIAEDHLPQGDLLPPEEGLLPRSVE